MQKLVHQNFQYALLCQSFLIVLRVPYACTFTYLAPTSQNDLL